VLLFERVEGFSCAFDMVRSEWGTMSAEGKNSSAKVGWAVNDMFLAGFGHVCEEEIVESSADDGMGIGNFGGPEIKNLACPWGDVAYNF
jgi:hypothetical protein